MRSTEAAGRKPAIRVSSVAISREHPQHALFELVYTAKGTPALVAWRRWSDCARFSKQLQRRLRKVPNFPGSPVDLLVNIMGNARFEHLFLEARRVALEKHLAKVLFVGEDALIAFMTDPVEEGRESESVPESESIPESEPIPESESIPESEPQSQPEPTPEVEPKPVAMERLSMSRPFLSRAFSILSSPSGELTPTSNSEEALPEPKLSGMAAGKALDFSVCKPSSGTASLSSTPLTSLSVESHLAFLNAHAAADAEQPSANDPEWLAAAEQDLELSAHIDYEPGESDPNGDASKLVPKATSKPLAAAPTATSRRVAAVIVILLLACLAILAPILKRSLYLEAVSSSDTHAIPHAEQLDLAPLHADEVEVSEPAPELTEQAEEPAPELTELAEEPAPELTEQAEEPAEPATEPLAAATDALETAAAEGPSGLEAAAVDADLAHEDTLPADVDVIDAEGHAETEEAHTDAAHAAADATFKYLADAPTDLEDETFVVDDEPDVLAVPMPEPLAAAPTEDLAAFAETPVPSEPAEQPSVGTDFGSNPQVDVFEATEEAVLQQMPQELNLARDDAHESGGAYARASEPARKGKKQGKRGRKAGTAKTNERRARGRASMFKVARDMPAQLAKLKHEISDRAGVAGARTEFAFRVLGARVTEALGLYEQPKMNTMAQRMRTRLGSAKAHALRGLQLASRSAGTTAVSVGAAALLSLAPPVQALVSAGVAGLVLFSTTMK